MVTGLLLPAILASIPTMLNLRFGQFHAMAIMLAVAAMVAFVRAYGPFFNLARRATPCSGRDHELIAVGPISVRPSTRFARKSRRDP